MGPLPPWDQRHAMQGRYGSQGLCVEAPEWKSFPYGEGSVSQIPAHLMVSCFGELVIGRLEMQKSERMHSVLECCP